VDPKPKHKEFYKNVSLITPNKKEAEEMTGIHLKTEEDIESAGKKLAEEMNSVPEKIKELAKKREEARSAKDFKTSDGLRAEIQAAGYAVMDTDSGPIVHKSLQ